MIYAFAVVSPDHIPAGIATRKIKVPRPYAAGGGGGGGGGGGDRASQAPKHQEYYRIFPSQPPFSCIDRRTRAEVLRIFYKRNTFLFRVTPLIQDPVCRWLEVMVGKTAYAGGAAKLIERVAVELEVRKSCVQRVEDLEETVEAPVPGPVPVHIYRERKKKEQQQQQQHHQHQQQPQTVQQRHPYPSTSTYHPLALAIHYEADLAPMCACTLQLAASLAFPTPWDASSQSACTSPLAANVVSFAFDLQALFYCGFSEGCKRFGLCDEEQTKICEVCGKLVLWRVIGGMNGERGFGGELLPYGYSRREEGRGSDSR
jgi:hypothetical protein